ncbi:RidA family protein [uncultured Ruegeria sp.]|uniref:RidA family protein n=1 Tax=uncultured Ruegeria sp. TaxID=259304 RepID=UPI0026202477|nr:RidA family protein [uncultured Ruegeria sp.]
MVRAVYSPKAAQHLNPVPNAAVHNGLLITSGILGKELHSGAYPTDKERQVTLVFQYLEAILAEAGADLQDVVKLDLYFADKADRDIANTHWLRLWPDQALRPARQAHQVVLPPGCCLQAVATAMLAQ